MMVAIFIIIIAVVSFFIGLYLGNSKQTLKSKKQNKTYDSELRTLIEEYKNFLNYDGTEQL